MEPAIRQRVSSRWSPPSWPGWGSGPASRSPGGCETRAPSRARCGRAPRAWCSGRPSSRDPGLAGRLVASHGAERVAVALDVRDGLAVGHGWRPGSPGVPVGEALDRLAGFGVATFEVTAIDRDGTLAGPDLALLGRLVALGRGAIIASAGISSPDGPAGRSRPRLRRGDRRTSALRGAPAPRRRRGRATPARDGCRLTRGTLADAWIGAGRLARRSGQWPAASLSFLCASITFSARCDGTSS